MKKSLRSATVLAVCLFSLTSCGEVSFADFQTKATDALKTEVSFTKGTVSGTYVQQDDSSKTEKKISANLTVTGHVITPASILNVSDNTYCAIVNVLGIASFTATEDTEAKYYAGSDFKFVKDVKDEDSDTKTTTTIKWNSNGLLTSYEGNYGSGAAKAKYKFTVSYSK